MKTIQLKGAALEAALNVRRITEAHERGLDELKERFAKEVDTFCSITQDETHSQLAIIERAAGVTLTHGEASRRCVLDLRYVTLGYAFVNIEDEQSEHGHEFSETLS